MIADRIQARAVRRMGELLKQFDGKGNNQHTEGKVVALPTQKQVADTAGISEHQRKQAVHVANVTVEQVETAVESEKPLTVTVLAVAAGALLRFFF